MPEVDSSKDKDEFENQLEDPEEQTAFDEKLALWEKSTTDGGYHMDGKTAPPSKTVVSISKGARVIGRKRMSIFWPLKDWEKPVADGGFGTKAKKQQIEEFDRERGVM
jgi:hypothetical protein